MFFCKFVPKEAQFRLFEIQFLLHSDSNSVQPCFEDKQLKSKLTKFSQLNIVQVYLQNQDRFWSQISKESWPKSEHINCCFFGRKRFSSNFEDLDWRILSRFVSNLKRDTILSNLGRRGKKLRKKTELRWSTWFRRRSGAFCLLLFCELKSRCNS